MTVSNRTRRFRSGVIRTLLRLYPSGFRARYGREIEQLVRASWQHDTDADRSPAFWGVVVADLAAGAVRERIAAVRDWRRDQLRQRLARTHGSSDFPSTQGDGMGTLTQDLRYAWRTVRKSPGFALVVIVSLALGIGANTLIYSVVDGIVLRPFPYPNADRLVAVGVTYPAMSGERRFIETVSPPEYNDIKAGMTSLDKLFAFDLGNRNISGGDQPERVFTGFIWGDPMASVGVRPLLGRSFRVEETTTRGPSIGVISHRVWQSRFGGDSAIVGKSIRVNGEPTEIIGVMPPRFLVAGTDLWLPMGVDPSAIPRQARQWTVIGRLRDGVTLDAANVEMKALTGRIEREYGRERKEYAGFRMELDTWTNAVVGEFRPAATILLGAVALVLLIACANIASLLLARATARQRELAVRRALGAGRFRIARQLFTESVLLALVGGGVGLALAYALLGPTSSLFPAQLRSAGITATINGRVLLYTLGAAVASGLLFGVAPALQGIRGGGREWLTGEGAAGRLTTSAGGRRARNAFVVAEIALSLMLLVGAGVLLRSFTRLQGVDPGFDTRNVLTMRLSLPREQYKSNAVGTFFEEVSRRLATVPGVRAAGATTQFPPGNAFTTQIAVDGQSVTTEQLPMVDITNIAGEYFTALGYKLKAGRLLGTTDDDKAPAVAVINESAARKYFSGGSAAGPSPHAGRVEDAALDRGRRRGERRAQSRPRGSASAGGVPAGASGGLRLEQPALPHHPHAVRSVGNAPRRSSHDRDARPNAARVPDPYAGRCVRRGRVAATCGHAAHHDLRRGGARAGGSRDLRTDVVHGQRAHARDRHPHGVRRRGWRRPRPHRPADGATGGDRCRAGPRGRDSPGTRAHEPRVRGPAERSGDAHGRHGAADAGRARGHARAGHARDARHAAGGAAARVAVIPRLRAFGAPLGMTGAYHIGV